MKPNEAGQFNLNFCYYFRMKFRIFSIFAGIGQSIGMIALFYVIQFILRILIPDEVLSFGLLSVSAIVWLVGCAVIGLWYPIHLLKQRQKADGIVVIVCTIVSFLSFTILLMWIVDQMFRGID